MLWVRNNFSTIISQLVDTILVVSVLFIGTLPLSTMGEYIWDGWLFKIMVAACDTIAIYVFMWWARGYFGLEVGEEIDL